jgi:hypothetical protein
MNREWRFHQRVMAIAAAVTPTSTTEAIALIGVSATELNLA